ncbi:MAG: 2-hydroxyacid dehydrogenase [Acidobacteriota bacterium]
MRVAVFSTKTYDQCFLEEANKKHHHELAFFDTRLTLETTPLAKDFGAVCAFVNDELDRPVLQKLAEGGTKLIALRSAGFNHVDLPAAADLGLRVARVPAYSPAAVAEHSLALVLTLNRKVYRAYNRVRDGNFSLEGLLGFDLEGKTVGVVGTGKIGGTFARIMLGFKCRVLAFDPYPSPEYAQMGVRYVDLPTLLSSSDIISLHCPLTVETQHLINQESLRKVKRGVMLINTGRGALIDTRAVIQALKEGVIGYLGLDVYEEEEELFFRDLSGQVIQDDTFARLQTFPNVVITGHQAFFTREALTGIAETTLGNITAFETGQGTFHEVPVEVGV